MKHCMTNTLGTGKKGAYETEPQIMAELRGSGSEPAGARALEPGCLVRIPPWPLASGLTTTNYLLSLCLSFPLFKLGLIIIVPIQRIVVSFSRIDVCKVLRATPAMECG